MWDLDYKESWTPKNWCFWTVVLEETLDSPLDCKEIQPVNPKGNQSYSLVGLMLKLKLLYFGHLMQRTDSLEKTQRLKEGGEGDKRGWDGWMASLTRWKWVWASSRSWPMDREASCAAVHEVTKQWTWLSDWTTPQYCTMSTGIHDSFVVLI